MHDALIRPSRRTALGLIGSALLWPGQGRADSLEAVSGTAFGTTWRIVGPSGAGLDRLRPGILELFGTVDRQMSPWRQDSAVSLFNAGFSGWRAAEEELVLVTRRALALAEASDGAFDPTVGPLVARWGFGPIKKGGGPNWRGLSVDARQIAKSRDDLTLDLCGIAKGRALDQAIELAGVAGLGDLLFDLGGELMALGRHPSGRDWRVAVQHPVPGEPSPAGLRLVPGRAVATSGLRTQSFSLDGRTYGHIIDPTTRTPADAGMLSVTVLAADAMSADGWATALFAAGAADGPALARARGIDALFLVGDASMPRKITTGALEDYLL